MLKHRSLIPLDYSLCSMTVTVYDPQGGRRVIGNTHYEFTRQQQTAGGKTSAEAGFLLVIPGEDPIAPGDRVVLGVGGDCPWEELNPAQTPTLGIVRTVKPRYFLGRPCHTEARG